jgi:hypothetical protein
MSEYTPSALAMLTEFVAADDIEHTARRTGFVQRASKITGKIFLALVTVGVWSDATTTLAQLATKVTQLGEQREVSPEALHQRMNKRALGFLQEMIRQALTKGQALKKVCDDGLFTYFTKVYLIDSTGFGLPDILKDLLPGSGGSAAKAGAKIQAVWD